MFYANFVLAKKGPLARVWLAAHWEKKLSKAHVFETDLESSVDNIISPKVKIALRTSGHLLLGVVRIYSRKAKYLLADCTEALIKIKMAFRPDVVDLPLVNQKDAVSAVTLPELQDWDQMVNDLGTFDINTFNNNVCRVEDITMKEDLITSRYLSVTDDNFFGDTPFGEISDREILRDDAGEGRSFVNEENSVLGEIVDDANNTTKGDDTLTIDQTNLELGMADPMMGGGDFKAGEGLDFMEGFGIEGISEVPGIGDIDDADPKLDTLDDTLIAKDNETTNMSELEPPKTPGAAEDPTIAPMADGIEDISMIPGPNQVLTRDEEDEDEEMESQPLDDDEEEEEEIDEIGAGLGETAALAKSTYQADNDAVFGAAQPQPEPQPEQQQQQQQQQNPFEEPFQAEPEAPTEVETLQEDGQETDFMTTLFSRDEEALNLEPIEVVDKKNKPKKRKRKLVVDQEKILVTEQIKAQIKCDEDIIKTAVVAPPTKARFVLLESSTRSCFAQPPSSIQTKRRRLNEIYNLNMTLEKPEDFVLPSSQDDFDLEKVPEKEVMREEVEQPIEEQIEEIEKINGVQEVLELPAALGVPPEEVVEEEIPLLEEEVREEEFPARDIFQELVQNNDEIEKHIEMDEEMKEVEEELRNEEGVSIAPAFELIRQEQETAIELEDDGFQVMYEENEEEEEEDEDPHLVDNSKRWTSRTHQTLKAVQKGLKRKQPIYFTDLTKKCTRKQAAYTFYTLLILSKEQALDVQQEGLFETISVDRGKKFDAHV